MVKRSGFLLDEIKPLPTTQENVRKYRYYQVGQMLAFVLALASEIDFHFDFGLKQDALFAWALASSSIEVVAEMYEKRYRKLLAG
jgi:hypothetical protein